MHHFQGTLRFFIQAGSSNLWPLIFLHSRHIAPKVCNLIAKSTHRQAARDYVFDSDHFVPQFTRSFYPRASDSCHLHFFSVWRTAVRSWLWVFCDVCKRRRDTVLVIGKTAKDAPRERVFVVLGRHVNLFFVGDGFIFEKAFFCCCC